MQFSINLHRRRRITRNTKNVVHTYDGKEDPAADETRGTRGKKTPPLLSPRSRFASQALYTYAKSSILF